MDARLNVERLPPARKRGDAPRWRVRYDGALVGYIEETQIGHRRVRPFYRPLLVAQGQEVDLGIAADFDERVEALVAAWRDPASNVHARYWLKL